MTTRIAVAMFIVVAAAPAQEPPATPTIARHTKTMQRLAGFMDLHWDAKAGKLFLTIPALNTEFLYATALSSGLGSNPVGLDRGSLGPRHLVEFQRSGPKVLLIAKNMRYRAISENPRERAAVTDSFAPSVLWGFTVAAEESDKVLVDATDFFLRDAVDVVGRLQRAGQGSYSADKARSAFHLPRTKAFPDNVEIESTLTFTASTAGSEVARTAAAGKSITLRQHHSLIRLPDDGYRRRKFDIRVGYSGPRFSDYAAPIDQPMHRQWIARHRLVKRDPAAAVSEPVEPIIYYLDPGTPEPIRNALRDGAMWWAKAFEAAGFRNAFRVEDLPDDADPMDVRYNMIHWVHRSTRGWSYGASITDPRTGEILKGNVLLGSLRVRQDHMKFAGLHGEHACSAAASPDVHYLIPAQGKDGATEVALARIRQLSAHEVGHTLGLSHNFAASTYGRASVMDYPAPLVKPGEGDELDFSDAYGVGVGEYDIWAIRYGYTQFGKDTDENEELGKIITEGLAAGMIYLTDQDARASSTGHPLASLWDNGNDPVAMLRQEMQVRAIGLRRFSFRNLRPGAPVAQLEDLLVPLYLHHRFQLQAALKVIGGVDYRHAVKGDGQASPRPAAEQPEALKTVLETLTPEFLTPSPALLGLIPPAPPGHSPFAERFPRGTGVTPDPIAMAVTAADLTVSGLLERHRAARLVANAATPGLLRFRDVVRRLLDVTWGAPLPRRAGERQVMRAVQTLVVDRLMQLADDPRASHEVRSISRHGLGVLFSSTFALGASADPRQTTHQYQTKSRIERYFENRPMRAPRTPAAAAPPGSPIGTNRQSSPPRRW